MNSFPRDWFTAKNRQLASLQLVLSSTSGWYRARISIYSQEYLVIGCSTHLYTIHSTLSTSLTKPILVPGCTLRSVVGQRGTISRARSARIDFLTTITLLHGKKNEFQQKRFQFILKQRENEDKKQKTDVLFVAYYIK